MKKIDPSKASQIINQCHDISFNNRRFDGSIEVCVDNPEWPNGFGCRMLANTIAMMLGEETHLTSVLDKRNGRKIESKIASSHVVGQLKVGMIQSSMPQHGDVKFKI